MPDCDCGRKLIAILPFTKTEEIFYTAGADGKKLEARLKSVPICPGCYRESLAIKAGQKAVKLLTAIVIAAIVTLAFWFFARGTSESHEAPAAVAPKATASKPILIPPENRDAWRR